jgi:hypothetical protein
MLLRFTDCEHRITALHPTVHFQVVHEALQLAVFEQLALRERSAVNWA